MTVQFPIAGWQAELLDIIRVNAAAGDTVANTLSHVQLSVDSGTVFTDLPAGFDIVDYAERVLLTNYFPEKDLANAGPDARKIIFGDSYTFILEFISVKGADDLALRETSGSFDAPLPGVDGFTWNFLLGAWATNTERNIGNDFGLIGWSYNNFQYEIRFGAANAMALHGDDGLTREASDAIGERIAREVFEKGGIVSLFDFGHQDGSAADPVLWDDQGSRVVNVEGEERGIDFGGWAGTPFFTLLRTEQFFQRDILHYKDTGEKTNLGEPVLEAFPDNPRATAYDLLAMTQALSDATTANVDLTEILETIAETYDQMDGAADGFIESVGTAAETVTLALAEFQKADEFIEQAYGSLSGLEDIIIGALIFGPLDSDAYSFLTDFSIDNLIFKAVKAPGVGTLALGTNLDDIHIGVDSTNEYARSTSFSDIVHAGRGDDIIFADGGSDIIDGGEGHDIVDYSNIDVRLDFRIFDMSDLDVGVQTGTIADSFVGTVARGDWLGLLPFTAEDMLYGIESIIATDHDDKFYINRLRRDLTINGNDGDDWVSFKDSQAGINIQVGGDGAGISSVDASSFSNLTFVNFEGIEGSEFDDVFVITDLPAPGTSSDTSNAINHISGGDGVDTIDFSQVNETFDVDVLGGWFPFGTDSQFLIYTDTGKSFEVYDVEKVTLTQNGDVVRGDLSQLAEEGKLEVIELAGGDDVVELYGATNLSVKGGTGADTIQLKNGYGYIYGGAGQDTIGGGGEAILNGGSESDTFLFAHANLAADADSTDYVSWGGALDLFGGIRWGSASESAWAGNTLMPLFRYAGNIAGEMVIELAESGAQFFIANWQGGPGVSAPTGHVQVQEINLGSSRLLDFDHTMESLNKNLGEVLTALFQQMFGKPFPDADPIVLDLDGDGLELAAPVFTSPYFDIDEDQFAERTGWVLPDDGFLAHDANGNGTVDGIAELFGSTTTDGFTELTALDSNGDGVIDALDTEFSNLRIWQDLDGLDTEFRTLRACAPRRRAANDNGAGVHARNGCGPVVAVRGSQAA